MDHLQQIAQRLKGLREAMDVTVEAMAEMCEVDTATYAMMERGEHDIAMSTLQRIATKCGVELPALLFGDEPRMSSYFITRRGQGALVERSSAYSYRSLAAGFAGRRADPFIVTVHPLAAGAPLPAETTHAGQEFNIVLEGSMELHIGGRIAELATGDSIYFDAELGHRVVATGGKPVKFLAIIF